jgi:hypothetical protein
LACARNGGDASPAAASANETVAVRRVTGKFNRFISKSPAMTRNDLAAITALLLRHYVHEHDPEKWIPVFRKDHAPPKF